MIFTYFGKEKKEKKKKRKYPMDRVDGYDDRNELQPGLDGKELLYSGKCIDWN